MIKESVDAKKTKLQCIRECLGVSPEEITRYTTISSSTYVQTEQGRTQPTPHTVTEIVRGLNATLSTEKRRRLRAAGFLCDDEVFTERTVFNPCGS